MKKAFFRLLVATMVLVGCMQLTAVATQDSHLERYIGLYGYRFTETAAQGIRREFSPQTADCGPVQISFREVLYDGQWLYTAASVLPMDSDTLILPGDSEIGDSACGHYFVNNTTDTRSYQAVATEEDKQVLAVYVYIKEFDKIGEYFLDSYQADETILFSGAAVAGGNKPVTLTWTVQLYEVDRQTGKYQFLSETTFPMTVEPLEPYAEYIYYPTDDEKTPLESVVLIQTALGSYLKPQWRTEQEYNHYRAVLADADRQEVVSGGMPSGIYALFQQPESLSFVLLDLDGENPEQCLTVYNGDK